MSGASGPRGDRLDGRHRAAAGFVVGAERSDAVTAPEAIRPGPHGHGGLDRYDGRRGDACEGIGRALERKSLIGDL